MGTHTFEQTIRLEVARDILNGRIAAVSARLADEERRSSPDQAAIDAMEDEMLDLGVRIDALDVRDDAAVGAVIEENRLAHLSAE